MFDRSLGARRADAPTIEGLHQLPQLGVITGIVVFVPAAKAPRSLPRPGNRVRGERPREREDTFMHFAPEGRDAPGRFLAAASLLYRRRTRVGQVRYPL